MQAAPVDIAARSCALFLDVDGTLLELREHPDDVRAEPALVNLLRRTQQYLDGALALVSGRPVADVDRIFSPARFPAAGAHGAELRLADGETVTTGSDRLPPHILAELETFVRTRSGLLIEQKSGGVALHYRRAPKLAQQCRDLLHSLHSDISECFRLLEGKMVLELVPRAVDKGDAVLRLLAYAPFCGRRPVFVGDDVTDEDGFRTVNERAGISICVGDAQSSEAQYALPNVTAVHAWLCAIIGESESGLHEGGC